MIRRPLSIIFLSIIFFLSPTAILIFNAALNMVPLIGYGSILYRLQITDLLILLLYLLTGISIYLVKKWGWWVIISSASIMFGYNLVTFFKNPFSSVFLLLIMNLSLFVVALIFFRRHLIAPYFNPQLRWWEQDQRYKINIYLKILGIDRNVIISDISAGGCFVYVDFNIDPGTELSILIVCDTYHINLNAKVMRIIRESDRYMGYGLMFTRINEAGKQGLTGLMEKIKNISRSDIEDSDSLSENKRHFTRFFIGYHISIEIGQNHNPATLVDISKSGCCVQTEADYETNLSCFFSFSVKHSHFKIDSRIIWRRGESGNRIYGIQFMKRDRATISPLKELISHASKLGASKKELNKDRYFDSCDKKLENTPYVLIKFIKKILKIKNGK